MRNIFTHLFVYAVGIGFFRQLDSVLCILLLLNYSGSILCTVRCRSFCNMPWRHRGVVELYSFFNLGARWGQRHAPAALHPARSVSTHCAGGCLVPRAGIEGSGEEGNTCRLLRLENLLGQILYRIVVYFLFLLSFSEFYFNSHCRGYFYCCVIGRGKFRFFVFLQKSTNPLV